MKFKFIQNLKYMEGEDLIVLPLGAKTFFYSGQIFEIKVKVACFSHTLFVYRPYKIKLSVWNLSPLTCTHSHNIYTCYLPADIHVLHIPANLKHLPEFTDYFLGLRRGRQPLYGTLVISEIDTIRTPVVCSPSNADCNRKKITLSHKYCT